MSPGTRHPHPPSMDAAPQHLQESHAQYSSLFAWNEPFQFSSSEWIDWNVVFPPGPEVQVPPERTEPLPALSTPVWT